MAEPNSVEIIEVCLVAPSPADHHDSLPNSLPLTFFDLRYLRLAMNLLYFYEISAPEEFFHTNIIPRLKHSLSLTLGRHFLPIAGKLIWPPDLPKPVLTYALGDAVPLVVALSHDNFALLASNDNVVCDATTSYPLSPDLQGSSQRSSVITIQLTVFPNCGLSIGITMNHGALDGKTLAYFVKSWAHVCRSLGGGDRLGEDDNGHEQCCGCLELPAGLKPFYDRVLIKDPANLETIFTNQWLNFGGPENRIVMPPTRQVPTDFYQGTFQMPKAKVEKLRQLVSENEHRDDHHPDIPLHVSTFSLTAAYAWICLIKAEVVNEDNCKSAVLDFPVDCRSRLEPPLPTTYFGNCVSSGLAVVERDFLLGKEGFFLAVKAISEAIKSLETGVLDGAENWVAGLTGSSTTSATPALEKVYTCAIAWSNLFGFYSTDFGWGRPRKVDEVSIYVTEMINIFDGKNEDGGVQVGLVLKKHHMEAFASLFVEGIESL